MTILPPDPASPVTGNAAPDAVSPPGSAVDPDVVEPKAVRRAFSRAAATYDHAAVLQREVNARLLGRLDYMKIAPQRVLDAGCGTGHGARALATRYPKAAVAGVDNALPMIRLAQAASPAPSGWTSALRALGRRGNVAPVRYACADINALPFAADSVDLVISNLVLQWVADVPRAFAELHRVLAVDGLLCFATLGPDTLRELRGAFADGRPHVNRFTDMHDLGDMLVHAGFADPVMDIDYMTLTYPTARALLNELKALGATNAATARPRGLMGRGALARVEAALTKGARDGRIPATFEVVHGHAWKAPARTTADGHAIIRFRERA
jgi:malonyl-CoA O-methyltransferase